MQHYTALGRLALSNNTLRQLAPSVFANDSHGRTSARYTYIPTIRIVDGLRTEGWLPTLASESRVRDGSRMGYQKHLIRFRHSDQITPAVGMEVPEIVLVNSHDGSSSYQLMGGFFRFVCINGLIVASHEIETQRIRHSGDIIGNVIEGAYRIVEELPRVANDIEQFKALTLKPAEQLVYARAAMRLRWEKPEESGFSAHELIRPKRHEDAGDTLWSTFNRVQEHLVKGGLEGMRIDSHGRRRRTTSREIKGIDQNLRLNQALWQLTSEMAALKS